MAASIFGYGASVSQRNLGIAQNSAAQAAARLSSGMRIVNGDGTGGDLAAADQIRSQIGEMTSASRNLKYATTYIAAFDSLLQQIQSVLGRARDIADLLTGTDAVLSEDEAKGLTLEQTTLNTQLTTLYAFTINGKTFEGTIEVQMADQAAPFTLTLVSAAPEAPTDIKDATEIQTALTAVQESRSELSAQATVMNAIAATYDDMAAAFTDAVNNFVATDYASETAKLTQSQILQQSAAAMLAQANQSANVVLALLK